MTVRGQPEREGPAVVLSRSEIRSRAVNRGLLRDQGGDRDHLEMLSSLVYRSVRCLSGLLTVLIGTCAANSSTRS
jgi:hypothetical protein